VEGKEFVLWQGHDFSMRGLDSIDATVSSGLGHLTSFYGTDSLPTLYGARYFYDEKGFVGGSVPATEHSVMCAGSKEDELGTFKRLMETYPKGILSVVSDTWDLWNVITNILPKLKEQILGRDGKLVIRPDSGDPVDILCGLNTRDKEVSYTHTDAEYKGVIELLWDIFGGTTNSQGYKVLDSHIGAIYGDSITTERAEEICKRLESKGFASTNVVFGIGSFTYQYNTRDTFGFAMKATYVEKEVAVQVGTTPENLKWTTEIQGFEIFKDPVTDNGMKKSAKGLLRVVRNKSSNQLLLEDECSWSDVESEENQLKVVFKDGEFVKRTTLTEIRERLTL
jgi:nicotinamide phosphoribosyltransferase